MKREYSLSSQSPFQLFTLGFTAFTVAVWGVDVLVVIVMLVALVVLVMLVMGAAFPVKIRSTHFPPGWPTLAHPERLYIVANKEKTWPG